MNLAVVKLGGSAAASASLADWLVAIEASTQPLVLVPGGGPFADAVRDSQQALGFSDETAHAMALLAMEQFGLALTGLARRFEITRSSTQIDAVLAAGKIPVWLPSTMVLDNHAIPASWDITSDSLSAWLAAKLNAQALLLIKQTDDFSESDDLASLTARSIVDRAFARFAPQIPLHIAGPRHLASAEADFARGDLPGEHISPALMRKAG